MELAGWFVGPIMEKIINNCSDYLEDQVGLQTGMKEALERLRENHPKIQAVVFAANKAQIISDQNSALNKWIWQLRDAIDEADDVLDELEYMKLKQQLTQNTEESKVRSATTTFLIESFDQGPDEFLRIEDMFPIESPRKTLKIGESGLKIDPNLKRLEESVQRLDCIKHKEQLTENTKETKERKTAFFPYESVSEILKIGERVTKIDPNLKQLEEAVKKLDKVSANVITFLHLVDIAKQEQKEQKVDFYRTRETGYLPRNDLIGRGKEKELVMEWLRNPSNEHWGNSLLSIVGRGGIGKTNLLQHVYKDDEITKLFDLKMWVCVSNNFDVEKVIADMLKCLKNERPHLETLVALQRGLNEEVMSKKFLLVLDDIWWEENQDISKWEHVLAPLASGGFGSKIMVTTRMDSVALKFAKVIKTKTEIYKLQGLEEDECLQLLNSHAFAGLEKELVMEWLRNPSHGYQTTLYKNISLLCIMGHGGMGKTTFLQQIYEDERTKEFDLKMWVYVSNKFDVKKVIADMLEYLDKKKPDLGSLDALQGRLQIEVRGKKFLLIMDDICVEEENRDISKWEKVLAPLAYGKIGSRILARTQKESFAMMIATVIKKKTGIFRLGGLEEDHCLQFLNSHAFAGVENLLDDYKKLRAIAGEIVKKLLRSPLAAKVIGGVLNDNLDERHWREVLESNLLDRNSINSILKLSYIVLPNHLQNCFAICCMFPQDHSFDKDDLVRMWIALGFIQPSQGMILEDIGGRYFNILVKKSLFEKVGDDYKIHDLIHESASNFFAQECSKVVGYHEESSSKNFKTIRHLSLQTLNLNILRKFGKAKHLHSLFLSYEASNHDFCNALIKDSKRLRLLHIYAPGNLEMISNNIGNLKHLRYLKIDGLNMTKLPRSLRNLYHLQYIIFEDSSCSGHSKVDGFLPSDINNFSNLRYVNLPENYVSSICGIGKLKSLKELNRFDLRDASGYKIGELENMNDLCILGINCLENIKDAEEACSAKLCEKRRLTDLTLWWSSTDSRRINLDENVLDNLHPPKCLRYLSIKRYMGARSAMWMNDVNLIFNLEKIKLKDCLEWETLPPFGKLRNLKSLELEELPKVKWLQSKSNGNDKHYAFPLLEVLIIRRLEALEDWFEARVAAEDGYLFPCLIELVIFNCPKLKEFLFLPPKLKSLHIENTGWKTLNFCSNSNPIPLETLEVIDCPNITSLPLADEITRLAALRYLKIKRGPNLISLGRYQEVENTNNCHLILNYLDISDPSVLLMEPLRSIAALRKLSISSNDEVVSFPNEAEQWFLNVSSSLSELEFRSLNCLKSLPSSLESLSSLQALQIEGVPMLRELPNFPPSLKRLTIIGECHPELMERYGEDGGSDRHKIAHIPDILIDFGLNSDISDDG